MCTTSILLTGKNVGDWTHAYLPHRELCSSTGAASIRHPVFTKSQITNSKSQTIPKFKFLNIKKREKFWILGFSSLDLFVICLPAKAVAQAGNFVFVIYVAILPNTCFLFFRLPVFEPQLFLPLIFLPILLTFYLLIFPMLKFLFLKIL